jgi:hypothetical protein
MRRRRYIVKTHIIVMVLNLVFDAVYVGFVTAAAMHFDKPSVLFWYLMVLVTGYNIKAEREETKKENNDERGTS